MKYHMIYDFFSQRYICHLLSNLYPNIYGYGSTIENAITCLKIRLYQLGVKNKVQLTNIHHYESNP